MKRSGKDRGRGRFGLDDRNQSVANRTRLNLAVEILFKKRSFSWHPKQCFDPSILDGFVFIN